VREARSSKLDPYQQYIDERVKAAAPDWIPATVLLREVRALGYPGGYSVLKDHPATLRPVAKPEPLIRFETEPGRQMQCDFATIRRGRDRLAVFVSTLGWSRAAYVEFVTDEWLETLPGCHERLLPANPPPRSISRSSKQYPIPHRSERQAMLPPARFDRNRESSTE
jgi:transposase